MMKTPQSKKTLTLISFYSSWTIFEGKHFDDFFLSEPVTQGCTEPVNFVDISFKRKPPNTIFI